MSKLWGGRFENATAQELELFSESISFDKRLYAFDIKGSMAHARMLNSIEIISDEELKAIFCGLNQIKEEIEAGSFEFDIKFEDIHMAIESRLIELTGDAGKKLHTARSRNDQVALDTRMLCLYEVTQIQQLLVRIRKVLVEISNDNLETAMPGYTHLQRAQVISLAHHLMAYYFMFRRDFSRLHDLKERILAEMPLGSGALAGTILPINRAQVAEELKFKGVSQVSLDSVSDRDYIVEFNAACSMIMAHLSRLSEELILWNTSEFGFITIADQYATGSSMMPQKKNPDIPELVRGKSARVIGNLIQTLIMIKGTPLAYNRDFQEDKESLFDSIDTTKASLSIISSLLENITFNKEKMLKATKAGFLNATEAMEYLISRGLPNRDAHHVIGQAVAYAIKESKLLEELTVEEWCQFKEGLDNLIDKDISEFLQIENCLRARKSPGGPAPSAMKVVVDQAIEVLKALDK